MRNYDPALGTYLEQDPYGVAFTGPNRYGYALGNPIAHFDPTGEIVPAGIIYGAAIWLGAEALSGFPTIICLEAAFDGTLCTNPTAMEMCQEAGLGVLIGFGTGKLIGVASKMLPNALPYLRRFHLDELGAVRNPFRRGKNPRDLPNLDASGKVHGTLPKIKDLNKYNTEDLASLKAELEESVQERIGKTVKLGSNFGHSQRQAGEQRLIHAIDKILKGR